MEHDGAEEPLVEKANPRVASAKVILRGFVLKTLSA